VGLYETAARGANKVLDVFFRNRHHYRETFDDHSGRYVLRDLMKFVRWHDDLFRPEQRTQDYLLGQRSVILRIVHIMNMTDEQILNLTKERKDED